MRFLPSDDVTKGSIVGDVGEVGRSHRVFFHGLLKAAGRFCHLFLYSQVFLSLHLKFITHVAAFLLYVRRFVIAR